MQASEEAGQDVSIRARFATLTQQYLSDVVNGSGSDAAAQERLRGLIAAYEELWRSASVAGVFSSNDELDDLSTTSLEVLWTPYIIADLYQRVQERPRSEPTRMPGEAEAMAQDAKQQQQQQQQQGTSPTTQSTSATAMQDVSRQEALTRSHHWFNVFFEWVQNVELMDEPTRQKYATYRPEQRTLRLELSRMCTELRQKWQGCEERVHYVQARRQRMRRLLEGAPGEGEGEGEEEAGSEEEEALRARALARLRWACYDACHQLQLSGRELAMLEAIRPEQRGQIAAAYQARLAAVQRGELDMGRQTYTILPGGMMTVGTAQQPQPVPAAMVANSGGVSSQALSMMANAQPFRQQVREELMVDRNPPTMSLEAFADKEMATMQRQMAANAEAAQQQAEEDARLGPEGVEERQRQKDSAWADWKDAHPAFGPTSKGNYA